MDNKTKNKNKMYQSSINKMKNIFISFLIIFLGVQSSCGQSKSAAPAPSNTVGVQWETTSLQDAKQKAVSLDKPLLVEFYSPDCSHCAEMNTFMSTKPAGDFINPKYVPYKVNLSSPEGEEIAKKYRVKDYPKFYVFDKSGAIKDIFSAGHDTASFKYFYDRQKNNTNTFAHLKSRLAAGERIDTNTLKEFIRNLWTTQDPMAAKAIDLWVDSKKPEELMIGTSWDISRKNLDGIQNKLATYMLQNRQAYYQKYGE